MSVGAQTRPHSQALVAQAARLRPVAAERAAATDAARRIAPEVAAGLVGAGFARHFVPPRWGGTAGTFTDLLAAVAVLGEGCASTAWCAGLLAIYGRMAAHLPPQGQRVLWASGPDTPLAGSVTPAGRVEAVPGGWRLSGEWTFTSGVDHAEWVLLGGLAPAVPPAERPQPRYFLVPRGSYRVRDTWFNVGLRGTGSNTVVLDGVPVPPHLSYPSERLWQGTGSGRPCHTVPFKAVNGLAFAAPALGAARAALGAWTDWMASKVDGAGRAAHETATVQLALTRAAGDIDAAQLLLERAAAVADSGAAGPLEVARSTRDFSLAAERLAGAVDTLFRAGGARAQREGGVLGRAWLDVHCAAGHFALNVEHNGAAYARQVFGSAA